MAGSKKTSRRKAPEATKGALKAGADPRAMIQAMKDMRYERLCVFAWWEANRLLHQRGFFPPELLPNNQRDAKFIYQHNTYLDSFALGNFPLAWLDVNEALQKKISQLVLGDQSSALKVLSRYDAAIHARLLAPELFSKECSIDAVREAKNTPAVLKTDDGGAIFSLHIHPTYGWNHIAKEIKKTLQKHGFNEYGRSNGKRIDRMQTLIKGIISLSMQRSGELRKNANALCYPNQSERSDYRLLNTAEKTAEAYLSELKKQLAESGGETLAEGFLPLTGGRPSNRR